MGNEMSCLEVEESLGCRRTSSASRVRGQSTSATFRGPSWHNPLRVTTDTVSDAGWSAEDRALDRALDRTVWDPPRVSASMFSGGAGAPATGYIPAPPASNTPGERFQAAGQRIYPTAARRGLEAPSLQQILAQQRRGIVPQQSGYDTSWV